MKDQQPTSGYQVMLATKRTCILRLEGIMRSQPDDLHAEIEKFIAELKEDLSSQLKRG